MADFLRGMKVIIIAVVLLMLPGVCLAAGEVPGEQPGEQPEVKPVLGVAMVLTDIMRAEHNAKPTDMFRGAINEKLAQKPRYTVQYFSYDDFTAFMGKKDILPDSVGLMRELKLAQLVEYGKSKNVDFLLVVIGDAKVFRHNQTHFNNWKDKDGHTNTSSYETDEVDYANVSLRAAYVDVKKGEYVQNYTVEMRSGSPDIFANPIRSVVNDGSHRVVGEFSRKFSL